MNLSNAQREQLLRDARNGTLPNDSQIWQTVQRGFESGNRELTSLYNEAMRLGGPSGGSTNKLI